MIILTESFASLFDVERIAAITGILLPGKAYLVHTANRPVTSSDKSLYWDTWMAESSIDSWVCPD